MSDSAARPVALTLVASASALAFGWHAALSSPTATDVRLAAGLSQAQTDFMFASFGLSACAGALVAGSVANAVGRVRALLLYVPPYVAGTLLMGLWVTFPGLVLGRLLCGLAVGYSSSLVPLYITEVAPARLRGALGVVNQVGIVSGILLVYLAAFPSLTRPGYWRALVLLSLVFAAVLAGGLLAIGVESPRWLLRVGRAEEARVALQTLRGARTDVDAEMKELVATEAPDASSAAAGVSFSAALRRPATLRALALGMGMMAMQQGSGVTAIVFNTKQLFEGLDPPLDASGRVEFDRARVALIGATLVSVVQVLFTVISALSVERRGRRFFLLLSTYGLAASLLSLAAAYGADAATGVRIALVIVFFAFFSLGLGPLPYVVCAEIFPTQLRGALLSVCVLTLWVTSFVVTLLFNALLDALSPAGTFCLFAAVCAAGGVALHVWLPETKGRSLEEVQALFGAPREPEAHPLELLSRDSSQSALRA